MGYHIHHTIVVTSFQSDAISEAHRLAVETFGASSIVSPLCAGLTNGYQSFMIAPDGSKEGWQQSDDMDAARAAFRFALRRLEERSLWVDWVEVSFGGDEPDVNTRLVDHTTL